MNTDKLIRINGKAVADGKRPLICTPLVGTDEAALLAEVKGVVARQPDLIEWRVDFFAAIEDTDQVVAAAQKIRALCGDTPLLLTRRAEHEGGQKIPLNEDQVVALYQAVAASGCIDLLDYELSNPAENRQALKRLCQQHRLQLVVSFHNFDCTPSAAEIVQILLDAEQAGADIAKVAVMPQQPEDVLTLLSATLAADRQLRIPLITMSMGAWGSLSRMFGGAFGSAVTFAVGESSSAPGQMAIEDVRTVVDIVNRQFDR